MEYAASVLGLDNNGPRPVLIALACSLTQETRRILLVPETGLKRIYGRKETTERFNCSFGLNEEHRDLFQESGMIVSAVGEEGEVRAVEIGSHPFFKATLFMPQLSSTPERPHPLLKAFVLACAEAQEREGPCGGTIEKAGD